MRKKVWERDNYTCRYCGEEMKEKYLAWRNGELKHKKINLTADHLIPRRLIPTFGQCLNYPINLVASCKTCDRKKGGKVKYTLIAKNILINLVRTYTK